MSFEELLEQIKKLPKQESRFELPDYVEMVIQTDQIHVLTELLEVFFGKPYRPDPRSPMPEHVEGVLENFGGLRSNQSLYFCEKEGFIYYAVIWPWSDQHSVTVKISLLKTKKGEGFGKPYQL